MLVHIGAGQWVDPEEVTGIRALGWDTSRGLPPRVEVDHMFGHAPATVFTETIERAVDNAKSIAEILNSALGR